jgi:hypothetical protein
MRCYFVRFGHIASVEELPGLSDEEAVVRSRALFSARKSKFGFERFELWDRARMVIQGPPEAPALAKPIQ